MAVLQQVVQQIKSKQILIVMLTGISIRHRDQELDIEARYNLLSRKIYMFVVTKFNWLKYSSLLSTESTYSSEWKGEQQQVDADFTNKIVNIVAFRDQNIHEWLLITVGCEFEAGGIIGPIFLKMHLVKH